MLVHCYCPIIDSVVDVRLINGASFTEGQVEILYQNATEWAPLCDISSSGNKLQYAANFICQRLGYYRLGRPGEQLIDRTMILLF